MLSRDVRVGEDAVALAGAAERRDGPVQDEASIVKRDDRLRVGQVRDALCGLRLTLGLRRHLVDHRVSLLALRRRLPLALRRLHQAGLDAELAEPQALVHLEAHLGTGQERQVVAAGCSSRYEESSCSSERSYPSRRSWSSVPSQTVYWLGT